jgi:hypothetical protein
MTLYYAFQVDFVYSRFRYLVGLPMSPLHVTCTIISMRSHIWNIENLRILEDIIVVLSIRQTTLEIPINGVRSTTTYLFPSG